MTDTQKVYLNNAQRYLFHMGVNSETIIAARRFGKSDGIIAPRILRNVQHMPRSAGAFYAATFQQALTRTIPAATAALSRWGYEHEKHFWIGRKAPDKMGFDKPYIKPHNWEHVIHFYNGSILHLLSQDVKFSANSLTLDYLVMDEARSVKKEKLYNEVIPAISGVFGHYKDIPWHKGITMVSDMPQGKEGEWLLQRKANTDVELIQTIEQTLAFIQDLKERKSTAAKNELFAQRKLLNLMRRKAHIYKEFDAIENIEILGEEYIAQMKRELTPLIFQTSILNMRITKLPNGFYANLNPEDHYYDAFDNGYLNNLRTGNESFDLDRFQLLNCMQDADIDQRYPLIIALDYNANINWIVTGQRVNNELRTIKSMFVKNQDKLRKLMENWADYYAPIKNKRVVYYYDSTAMDRAYADELTECFKDIVINTLTSKGWYVTDRYIGKPIKHHLKHQYIDDALTGRKFFTVRFNRSNNEFLIPAMEATGIRIGTNGFQKDKSQEKLNETSDSLLELRTDGTDAWDTMFIGAALYPIDADGTVSTATFFGQSN